VVRCLPVSRRMLKHLSLSLLLGTLTFAGCAAGGDDSGETGDAVTGDAPQQLNQSDKADAPKLSADTRILNCQLEYEAFSPAFAVRPAASFETTFGKVENEGAKAGDGAFTLSVHTNPHPTYNLSLIAQIIDENRRGGISYIVLPRPHVGGAFLFELGADISPVSFPAEGPQQYDNLRAYCSIRMP